MGCLKQTPRDSQTLEGTCLKFLYIKTHEKTKQKSGVGSSMALLLWLCFL